MIHLILINVTLKLDNTTFNNNNFNICERALLHLVRLKCNVKCDLQC